MTEEWRLRAEEGDSSLREQDPTAARSPDERATKSWKQKKQKKQRAADCIASFTSRLDCQCLSPDHLANSRGLGLPSTGLGDEALYKL